jgi:hypothetical protein
VSRDTIYSSYFFLATAAAIPPTRSPTAVVAIPIPIRPSLAILSSIAFFREIACLQSG